MEKTLVNGIELAYDRRGQGIPLVLIHGHPLDHTIWEPVTSLLEADFDLILPDLRGFGGSGAPRVNYQLTDMAADIAALLDHLKIEKAVLAGHSMGGYIALALARAYPKRLLGLALVASQIFADPPERKPVRYTDAAGIEKEGLGAMADSFPAKMTADPALRLLLRDIILRQSVYGVAQSLRAMAERPDSSALVAGFAFPVVVIHGVADALIPIGRAREGKSAMKQATMVEIDGAGHMPMMEAPQATARALKMFL